MIGNDIVDLSLAKVQSNWERKGFLEKQFTISEIVQITKSENPFFVVWFFWSMKEAAYKCHMQKEKARFFNPKRFECSTTNFKSGSVQLGNIIFYTTSSCSSAYIHTIATPAKNTNVKSKKISIAEAKNESKALKEAIVKTFSKRVMLTKDIFGIPTLYCNTKKESMPLSISHHGNFGAYAYLEK